MSITANWQVQGLCDWPFIDTRPREEAGALPGLAGQLPKAPCLALLCGAVGGRGLRLRGECDVSHMDPCSSAARL